MALIVPDSIPSKSSQGEKTLYAILRDGLPDDFYVWYEPSVDGLYPDFIVLGPSLGMLILEVKGWYANRIIRADSNFFDIKWHDASVERVETYQSPLRQGHNYFCAVADKLKHYSILVQHEGEYKGKLAFPIGVGAIMSNINATQAQEENILALLPQPQVAYRDELSEWLQYSERQLISRLKEMFKRYFPFFALTDDQISTIKGVIHPETAIKEVPATQESVPEEVLIPPDSTIIKTLDAKQEQVAKEMRNGHRLLSGVAGGGKTIILLSRAKKLAQEEGKRLVLCFNITLAAYLRSLVHEDDKNPHYRERIEVMHFNEWAKHILKRLPNPQLVKANQQDYDEVLGAQLLQAIAKLPPEQKWDSILVDEAHTFCANWFECCVNALKDPSNGDLLIVFDGNQTLYQRRKFTWKSVGVKAQGRTKRLNQNYRNTQEILEAAWNIVKSITSTEKDSEDEITFSIVEPRAALRQGSPPTLTLAKSRQKEVEAVIQKIQQLLEVGYESKDIAILYRRNTYQDTAFLTQIIQQLEELSTGAYWITENNEVKRNYNGKKPGIRILTSLSSLGLEFKAVLIIWFEQYADCRSSELETSAMSRRQLYVAMTRATDRLYLFGSQNIPLVDELQQAGCFDLRTYA